MIIAQPFKAGLKGRAGTSPEGTAEPPVFGRSVPFKAQAFSRFLSRPFRDLGALAISPRVKTRGYYQVSLRDSSHLDGQEGK